MKQQNKKRAPLVVALRRLRCPVCNSTSVGTQRTIANDATILARRVKCRACGRPFVVVFD